MPIFQYHYAVNTTLSENTSDAYCTGCSGDGISEMPVFDIAKVLKSHIELLQSKFPDAAFNVGVNFGICPSDVGQPQEVPDLTPGEDQREAGLPVHTKIEMGQPLPPGTYTARMTEASENADGSISLGFRVEDLDAKGADLIHETIGKVIPFNLHSAVAQDLTLEEIARKQKEDLERMVAEKEARIADEMKRKYEASPDRFDPLPRWVTDDPAAYRVSAELESTARSLSNISGTPYERCLALVINMIKTERAHGG